MTDEVKLRWTTGVMTARLERATAVLRRNMVVLVERGWVMLWWLTGLISEVEVQREFAGIHEVTRWVDALI